MFQAIVEGEVIGSVLIYEATARYPVADLQSEKKKILNLKDT